MNGNKQFRRLALYSAMFGSMFLVPAAHTVMAAEPEGRGTSWDILYSEIRENGSGKVYPVGERIYMDIRPGADQDVDWFFIESQEKSSHSLSIDAQVGNIVTLQSSYICENKECPGTIEAGGGWMFHLDTGEDGDEFSGTPETAPVAVTAPG